MSTATFYDLIDIISDINKKYNLNNKSSCKFGYKRGNGGYQVVLRTNPPLAFKEQSITWKFQSPVKCIYELYERDDLGDLSEILSYFTLSEEEFKRRYKCKG